MGVMALQTNHRLYTFRNHLSLANTANVKKNYKYFFTILHLLFIVSPNSASNIANNCVVNIFNVRKLK